MGASKYHVTLIVPIYSVSTNVIPETNTSGTHSLLIELKCYLFSIQEILFSLVFTIIVHVYNTLQL